MRNNLCPITVHRLMDMKWENIKSLYPSEHRDLLALSLTQTSCGGSSSLWL